MQVITSHKVAGMISARADNNVLLLMSLCQFCLAVRMSNCQVFLRVEGERQLVPISLGARGLIPPQMSSLYRVTRCDGRL